MSLNLSPEAIAELDRALDRSTVSIATEVDSEQVERVRYELTRGKCPTCSGSCKGDCKNTCKHFMMYH